MTRFGNGTASDVGFDRIAAWELGVVDQEIIEETWMMRHTLSTARHALRFIRRVKRVQERIRIERAMLKYLTIPGESGTLFRSLISKLHDCSKYTDTNVYKITKL